MRPLSRSLSLLQLELLTVQTRIARKVAAATSMWRPRWVLF